MWSVWGMSIYNIKPNMTDILDKIYDKLESQHYGTYLSAMCIFHSGYRPNLMIYPDMYVCLSCGARGKSSDLLKKLSNIPIIQKIPNFRNPWTKWMKKLSLGEVLRSSWNTLAANPSLGSYLEKRKVSQKIQSELGIGYREDWYTFPIRNSDNKIIGAVARAGEENTSNAKYIFPSEQEDMLYVPSWKRVKEKSEIYLTFGIIDAISLFILGEASMSTTRGKKADPRLFDDIPKIIKIIPDHAELPEAYELARRLGYKGKVLSVEYPYGVNDINDLLVYGKSPTGQAYEETLKQMNGEQWLKLILGEWQHEMG